MDHNSETLSWWDIQWFCSKARELMYTGTWENKTIEYLENEEFLNHGSFTKNVCYHLLNPFPGWHGPTRPWRFLTAYISETTECLKMVSDTEVSKWS